MDGEDSARRVQFGSRYLTDPASVFEHNAWDNVAWDEEQEMEARRAVEANSSAFVDPDQLSKYELHSDRYWDSFYAQHQNKFFKDRHWLFTEFPELAPPSTQDPSPVKVLPSAHSSSSNDCCLDDGSPVLTRELATALLNTDIGASKDCGLTADRQLDGSAGTNSELNATIQADIDVREGVACMARSEGGSDQVWRGEAFPGEGAKIRMFEVGCGVGNTVFPVLQTNNDPSLFMFCCDLSPNAIQLVRDHKDYDTRRCHAFVCDVTDPSAALPFPPASLDVIILIFVLSAINPDKLPALASRLASLLKPGGLLVLRDYGRYDLTQLRFKKGRCLGENFYVRGDGTKVYFSTQDELRALFTGAGLTEQQNLLDRRLQVNRGRQIKMYRVWIQCKFRRPSLM